MTDQSPGNAQFFLTAPSPCPYLEGQEERKLFTHLSGRRASTMHHMLSAHGFRRSQNLIYRPACLECDACKSVRVVAEEFFPSQRYRRILKRNSDVVGTEVPPLATQEQYQLFQHYLSARHDDGGMTNMSYTDYECMVEDTPVDSFLIEYRLTNAAGETGELIAVALSDAMHDGVSMVYSFFNPALQSRGLGNFIILEHIERAKSAGLPYVYLGYWVQDSPKMAYKARFKPLEYQAAPQQWLGLEQLETEKPAESKD